MEVRRTAPNGARRPVQTQARREGRERALAGSAPQECGEERGGEAEHHYCGAEVAPPLRDRRDDRGRGRDSRRDGGAVVLDGLGDRSHAVVDHAGEREELGDRRQEGGSKQEQSHPTHREHRRTGR